jgi:hypothetical protein
MDKARKILEGYVEWIAVGLGVLFLGWTVYGYLFEKPVAVASVGPNTNVSPAEVDPLVQDGPGNQLKVAMESRNPPPPMGLKPNLVEEIVGVFVKAPDSQQLVTPYTPLNNSVLPEEENSPSHINKVTVAALPLAPPMPKPLVSSGNSNVPANPAMAAGGGGPAGGGSGNGGVNAVDLNWNTIESSIPVAALAQSFKDANLPPAFQTTSILRVELFRREMNVDGSWSPDTEISSLDINPLMPLPDNAASPVDQGNYKAWAEVPADVLLICQPPFYSVLQGSIWYEPGTPNPNQANLTIIDDGFDPKNPGNFKGDPSKLTPRDRELYQQWLDKQAARQQQQQRSRSNPNRSSPQGGTPPGGVPGRGGGPGGGGPGGGPRPLAADPSNNNPGDSLEPGIPPRGPVGPPGMGRPPGPWGQPGGPGGGPPPSPGTPNTAAAAALLPQGPFNPAQQAEFKVWAHDVTALAGKTYQYKLRYVISNPVWKTQNLCKPPTLADQFSITSADSPWTDNVSVETDTNFYAVELKRGVHFDIFKWKNGVWQMQSVQVNPGDMVGSVDTGTKTDFTTGWTLVDIRDDPRNEDNKIFVLVSENGTIKEKELTRDQRSQEYQHLLDESTKSRAANAQNPGPGGPPSAPPNS